MEPDTLSPDDAVKALALISAIPVVVMALWADYFGRHLDTLFEQNPSFEREPELEKVRIVGILGLLLQFTLFLASSDTRNVAPLITNLIFLGAVFLQLIIESQLETRLEESGDGSGDKSRENSEKPEEIGAVILKTVISWLIGLTTQLIILFSSVKAGLWFGMQFHMTAPAAGLLAILSGAIGVGLGLVLNYACGPIYMKQILPHKAVDDPLLQSFLKKCVEKFSAKRNTLNPPIFSIIQLEKFRITTIIWVGLKSGWGPFKPVLFISQWMLGTLTITELEALILNQITHIFLQHPKKKFLLAIALIISTTALALCSVFATEKIFSPQIASDVIGPTVAILCFFVCFRVLTQTARRYEIETDLYTVENLGVSAKDLINALLKLDRQLQIEPSVNGPIHPDTQRRVDALRTKFKIESEVDISVRDINKAA